MAITINFEDFSNGVVDHTNPALPEWSGSGVFDKLMHAINGNILVQYESGRIKGPEYAQVYLGSMQTAIMEAMKFLLTKEQIDKDLELKAAQIAAIATENSIKTAQSAKDLLLKDKELLVKQAQIDKLNDDKLTAAKQRANIEKQTELYQRQKEGFDDNKYQKLFESQLSSWGLMFSSGMLTEKPSIITGDKVSQLYTKLTSGI